MESRIKIAVLSGALNVVQERISHRYSCGAQVIQGLLRYRDVPEIASLIAPQPARPVKASVRRPLHDGCNSTGGVLQ